MKSWKTLLVVTYISLIASPVFSNPFDDVPLHHWAYDHVKALEGKGVMIELPDGSFSGNREITRFELAYSLARTIEKLVAGEMSYDTADLRIIEELIDEFADELALAGLKVDELDKSCKDIQKEIKLIKDDYGKSSTRRKGSMYGNTEISGDIWVHVENLEYDTDTVDDDLRAFAQFGLNLSSYINDHISMYVRIDNEELVGREFGQDLQNSTFNFRQAYLTVKDLFSLCDVKIGRQFFKVGHSIALDNKLDAITFSKEIKDINIAFILADVNGANQKNGFGLKGIDLYFPFGKHKTEFYYIVNSSITADPVNYGLALDGKFIAEVDYFIEYGKSDPDRGNGQIGTAWLGGFSWNLYDRVDIELMYGMGDEEYTLVAGDVYYWHRYKDMFGRIFDGDAGTDGFQSIVPMGRTNASGSLSGIKDVFLKLSTDFNEKNSGCFIYERVKANDTNSDGDAAAEYKRLTLGLDHYYKPNTTFGLRYDTVVFDSLVESTNAGGWYRMGIDMKILF